MSVPPSNISLGTIGADAGIPNLNVASVPAEIRHGDATAMRAYSEGLAFEDMLVNELTQQLSKAMFDGSGSAETGAPGADGGSGTPGGLLGGAGAYASMVPQALTSSIMANGGLGMARSFAQELDPALRVTGR